MKRVGKKSDGFFDGFPYTAVKYDCDGWAKCSEYVPEEYDICHLKTKNGLSKRGWFNGYCWDGAYITKDDEIEFWKRKIDPTLS